MKLFRLSHGWFFFLRKKSFKKDSSCHLKWTLRQLNILFATLRFLYDVIKKMPSVNIIMISKLAQ